MTTEPTVDRRPRWAPSTWTLLFFLVVLALITRVSFLMHSIDEPLSISLALGITDFKLAWLQPPAPGQYFYVRLVQGLDRLVHDELTTLSLASALFSSLALVPMFFVLRAATGRRSVALAGTALAAFTDGYWLTGVRPVNDPVAVFFAGSTLWALLLGVDKPGWFLAAGALFGATLGFEWYTLYFLAPPAIVVGVLVLRRGRWITAFAGVALFVAAGLAALYPSVQNAGGWAQYRGLWRAAERATYTLGNFTAHLTFERTKSQFWHDLFLLWGHAVLAVPMLILALVGTVPLWRAGTRGRLFVVFGLGTLLHVLLAPVPTSRYYIYTAPILCAAAAAGTFFLCERLAARRSPAAAGAVIAADPDALPGTVPAVYAVGGFILVSIAVTLPTAIRVKTFRSPIQATYQLLLKKHGGKLANVDVFTDNPTASLALGYYRLKSGLAFANGTNRYSAVLPLLGGDETFYLLSDTAIVDGGGHLRLVDIFTWEPSLRNILQCAPEPRVPRTINIYELAGGLPDEYALRDGRLQPLLFCRDMDRGGWAGTGVEMILPHDRSSAAMVLLEGEIPPEFGFYFPFQVEYRLLNGGRPGEFTIPRAGKFCVALTLKDLPPGDFTVLQLLPPEYCLPGGSAPGEKEGRRLCLRLTRVATTSEDHPVLANFTTGWADSQKDEADTVRWTAGPEGVLDFVVGREGTVAWNASFRSAGEAGAVDLVVDGQLAARAESPVGEWSRTQTLRVPLGAGPHQAVFRHAPAPAPAGATLPGERVAPVFGTRNLQVTME